jgi:glyceraldehyde-3-phosphate dehydrogenase/erythrose-4-phosphate dehydrogenase
VSAHVRVGINGFGRMGRLAMVSTLGVNGTQVKVYAWYDNEWGDANRRAELAALVGGRLAGAPATNGDRSASSSVRT